MEWLAYNLGGSRTSLLALSTPLFSTERIAMSTSNETAMASEKDLGQEIDMEKGLEKGSESEKGSGDSSFIGKVSNVAHS